MIEVTKVVKGQVKDAYRLCIEPRDRGTICPTDEVIAKIKLIKASEKHLHKIANRFSGSGDYEGLAINIEDPEIVINPNNTTFDEYTDRIFY
jgi:hypothetical protein